MELTAYLVNWEVASRLSIAGKLECEVFEGDGEGLYVDGGDWPSDSCIQYREVFEIYELIRDSLSAPCRSKADAIIPVVMNDSFSFPQDLGGREDPELIAGSISPKTAADLLARFKALDNAELDRGYEALRSESPEQFQIFQWPSDDAFTGYFRQWKDLLQAAVGHGAGVFLHIG